MKSIFFQMVSLLSRDKIEEQEKWKKWLEGSDDD
jgi:hypothetical protein